MDPFTLLTIGTGALKFIDANNQYAIDEYKFQVNRQRSAEARDFKVQALQRRAIQEAEAAAGKQFDIQIAALQEAEARKTVTSGFEGQTQEALIRDVEARELRAKSVIKGNLNNVLDAIDDEIVGVNTEMKQRIENYPRGQKPNFIAHALSTAASAYAAEADVTGKNLFTGQAISKAKTSNSFTLPPITSIRGVSANISLP